jgi:hypothetical protein
MYRPEVEDMTMKNILYWGAALVVLIIFSEKSYALDIESLADQASLRCLGGIVAVGDSDRSVRQKCGEPLDIARKQDYGPIWIYSMGQSRFMYYLAFLNGKLQRIVSAPCSTSDVECYDLR